MAGLLDFLMGNNAAASPWGALYPTQAGLEADQAQQARDAAAAALARHFRGGPGIQPGASPLPAFGAGASPFSFAGPGSIFSGDNQSPAVSLAAPVAPAVPPAAPPASGFAGPGSMLGINPASIAAPPPQVA